VQQLGDHGQHAVEVARAAGTLQHVTERTGADGDLRGLGVDDGLRGGEDRLDGCSLADGNICGQGPRVAVAVLGRAELQRVDEDCRDHSVRQFAGGPQQGGVPVV